MAQWQREHPDRDWQDEVWRSHPNIFQVQMGRVALLRDMINWCPINPLRAAPMKADDSRMRALEAYMLAERSGKALEYGKH